MGEMGAFPYSLSERPLHPSRCATLKSRVDPGNDCLDGCFRPPRHDEAVPTPILVTAWITTHKMAYKR